MYFLGRNDEVKAGLFTVTSANAAAAVATVVAAVPEDSSGFPSADHLVVDNGKLYFKARQWCESAGYTVPTVYESNGTTAGTKDLRQDACARIPNPSTSTDEPSLTGAKPVAALWSTIFLSVLPMMATAAVILALKSMPGMFANLYAGGGIGIIILYLIAESNPDNIFDFMKWFIFLYTGVAYIVFTLASILVQKPEGVFEEMKDWIVVFVGGPFFIVIHVISEVPVTTSALAWIAYALLAALQMFISIAVQRTLPLVFGAICTFVISWKISREIVIAILGDQLGETEVLSTLGLMALQGIGIVLGAIFYASRRVDIDAAVRGALLKLLGRPAERLLTAGSGSETS
eukprot:TRINITY_DN19964_c0_g1_i1.p1 TRINITY_DN19964_c0_g1~~TRINITY_DN19964_c0_g1_i1.p1  ORF type:complete len:346 (+),score=52.56 TRINITY_DN19964_c0_g1_i1:492-1529(+)